MLDSRKKFNLIILALVFLLFSLSLFAYYDYQRRKNLEVYFLDVGQGDSVLVRTPDSQNILIDGGPDSAVLYKLGEHLPFYDKTIDLMILSHPHSDHVAGLVDVLKRYKVKKILGTGVVHTSPDYLKWIELVKEKNINFIKADGYKKIDFLNKNNQDKNVVLEVLYPFSNISNDNFKDLNESSIVVKMSYGDNRFLFTGDISTNEEMQLLQNNIDLKSDVLKVAHHGSKYSSSQEFLDAVSPTYAVIQVGKDNQFNHPHFRVLRNLEKASIEILRNDEMGDVVFVVGENGLELLK